MTADSVEDLSQPDPGEILPAYVTRHWARASVRHTCPLANDPAYEATDCGYTGKPGESCSMAGIASGCIRKGRTS